MSINAKDPYLPANSAFGFPPIPSVSDSDFEDVDLSGPSRSFDVNLNDPPRSFSVCTEKKEEAYVPFKPDNISQQLPVKKQEQQNGRICSIFSGALKEIREQFIFIKNTISFNLEMIKEKKTEKEIRLLEEESSFHFDLSLDFDCTVSDTGGVGSFFRAGEGTFFSIADGTFKANRDLKNALIKASLSKTWTEVYIDTSGKLCELENSALILAFFPQKGEFLAYGGKNAPEGFKVNGNPIEQDKKCFKRGQLFVLTDEQGKGIFYLDITNKSSPKSKPNPIYLAFSRALNGIREQFKLIETHISSSVEEFQRARQEERINQLKQKSDFDFDVNTIRSIKNDSLDIQEALLNASLSNSPVEVCIDNSGKLCDRKNSVLVIRFSHEQTNKFWAHAGPKANSHLVNSKPIDPQKIEDFQDNKGNVGSFQYDPNFKLTDMSGTVIVSIDIRRDQIEERALEAAEVALAADLLKTRKTSTIPQSFYIDSYGKQCNKNDAEAIIHYSPFTENFSVVSAPGKNLKLDGEKIGDAQSGGLNFKDGKNHFTSDNNPKGFTIYIPQVTEEAKIKKRSDRFVEALNELRNKKASDRVYIDDNGNLCDQKEDAAIEIIHKELATFTAHPISSENKNWKVNGIAVEKGGFNFNIRLPTSFTRIGVPIFSINEEAITPEEEITSIPREAADEKLFLPYTDPYTN